MPLVSLCLLRINMYKKQVIQTSNNKLLEVYDDVFTYHERYKFYNFIKNSNYRVSGSDGVSIDQVHQIFSSYRTKDIDKMGMTSTEFFQELAVSHNFFQQGQKQLRINLSAPSERNFVHSDAEGMTFLYYVNMDWELHWGGHTLFMDDNLQDAMFCCVYKPGRVVVFDGTIPHMIMTPTMMASSHRYSLAIQFNELPSA